MRVKAWTVSEGEVVRREQQKLHNEIRPNLTLKNKIGIYYSLNKFGFRIGSGSNYTNPNF